METVACGAWRTRNEQRLGWSIQLLPGLLRRSRDLRKDLRAGHGWESTPLSPGQV